MAQIVRDCKHHGETVWVREKDRWRCRKCRNERTIRARRQTKKKLVEELGGQCVLCGYNRCHAAMHFHHLDPAIKEFNVSAKGSTYSWKRVLAEAKKCVLLCSNCHSEVEAGVASIPTSFN